MRGRWPQEVKSRADYSKALSFAQGAWQTGSATQSITAVDLTRAIVFPRCLHGGGSGGGNFSASIGLQITGAGEVTIFYGWETDYNPFTATVFFSVLEFWKPPRSIQWVAGGAASRTLGTALSDYTKAMCLSTNVMAPQSQGDASAQVTGASAVTLTASNSKHSPMRWVVVEGN